MNVEKEVNVAGNNTGNNNEFSVRIDWNITIPDIGNNKKLTRKITQELENMGPVISDSVKATLSALETIMAAEFHKYFSTVITKQTDSINEVKVT